MAFVLQCGSSKVVYIGDIPTGKFSDEAILKLAEPFGKVHKYFTNRLKREVQNHSDPGPPGTAGPSASNCPSVCLQCFIEMEKAEDAEKMGEHCKEKSLKFNGKRLTIYVSRKYRQLKHGSVSSSVVPSESESLVPSSAV